MDPDPNPVDPSGIFNVYDRFYDAQPAIELGNEDVQPSFDIGFEIDSPVQPVQSKWDKYLVRT